MYEVVFVAAVSEADIQRGDNRPLYGVQSVARRVLLGYQSRAEAVATFVANGHAGLVVYLESILDSYERRVS